MPSLLRYLIFFTAGGGIAGDLLGRALGLPSTDNTAFAGVVVGALTGWGLHRFHSSPQLQVMHEVAEAMKKGDGAARLAHAMDEGGTFPVPMRLSEPCGHRADRVLVTTRLLTDMFDPDMTVQSQRLEALLRDAIRARHTEHGFADCTTGTFTSPGASVTGKLRIARWEGFPEGPAVIIGHDG